MEYILRKIYFIVCVAANIVKSVKKQLSKEHFKMGDCPLKKH